MRWGAGGKRGRDGRIGVRGWIVAAAAVWLAGPSASDARAQGLEEYDYANLGLRAIGIDVLYADASQSEGALGVGARADLGFLGPFIRVVPRFAFWNADVDADAVATLERQIEEVSELPPGSVDLGTVERDYWVLGLDLQWTVPDARIAPYLGLGLEAYILNDSGAAIGGTFLDDAVITAGVSGVAGLEVEVGAWWRVYADLRGTLVTDASNLALSAGVAYRLGP